MLYKQFRSVPIGTTAADPDWQKLQVTKGMIKRWIIFSDPEAANLLHVRVEYHGTSIMPFGGKDWIVGFFTNTPIEDNILLDVAPYELDIYAYNESTVNEHEYYIHPIIIRKEPVAPAEIDEETAAILEELMGGP